VFWRAFFWFRREHGGVLASYRSNVREKKRIRWNFSPQSVKIVYQKILGMLLVNLDGKPDHHPWRKE